MSEPPTQEEERVVELYERFLEQPSEARESFLDRACEGDPQLKALVLGLFAAENGPAGDLGGYEGDEHDSRRELLGATIGPYKLTGILGYGGAGTVYRAERADQRYSAEVAIKILDSVQPEVASRFRTEWQILANLSHPNIARILDAGELPTGQLYLIMEHIQGEALDCYCDLKRLSIRDRLKLFLSICGAVHFAHQRLVLHRDLKPANILVTDEGIPKLLDFGVATLLSPHGETRGGVDKSDQVWTVEFASPEQLQGRPLTTASDVYALGVILYGLLTGLPARRADAEDLEQPELASEAVRRAEQDPLRASSMRLLANARGLSPARLARVLSGDLDAILKKALEADATQRYSSVEALAAELRRYLAHEGVYARNGGWFYYSRRFVRRHAVGVTAAGLFGLFIAGSASALLFQNQRIRAEQERAELVSEFMLNVFSASDPFVHRGQEVTAGALLHHAGERIRFANNLPPAARAQLLEGIGRAYRRQEQADKGLEYLIEALEIRTSQLPFDAVQIAAVQTELAIAYRAAGQFEESEKAFEEAVRLSKTASHEGSADNVHLLTEMGRLELFKGQAQLAEQRFVEALALARRVFGPEHEEVAVILLDLANVASWRDEPAAAVEYAKEAVAITSRSLPPLHPDRVMAKYILADAYYFSGQVELAGALYEEVLPAQRRLYGPHAPKVADTLDALAAIQRSLGHLEQAERFARDALETQTVALGPGHYMTGYYQVGLAVVLYEAQQFTEAEQLLRQALSVYQDALPLDHEYVAAAEHWLGEVLLAQRRYEEGQLVLESAIERWARSNSGGWREARSQSALGEALFRQGQHRAAELLLLGSYQQLTSSEQASPEAVATARERIREFYQARGVPEDSWHVLEPPGPGLSHLSSSAQ